MLNEDGNNEIIELDDDIKTDGEENEQEEASEETQARRKKGRERFAQRFNENIKKSYKRLLNAGGNVSIAVVNYEFAYKLSDIFCETITQLLVEGNSVVFDQFGKYEVKTQPPKRVKTIFTDNKEVILPELKMIRFYPSPVLKARIRGELEGRLERRGGFFKNKAKKENTENIIEGEETDNGN